MSEGLTFTVTIEHAGVEARAEMIEPTIWEVVDVFSRLLCAAGYMQSTVRDALGMDQ